MRGICALILAATVSSALQAAPEQSEGWSAYGGDPGGARYSSLSQINAKNVSGLKVAWTFRTGELGQGVKDWQRSAFEATPILYNGTLYLTTSSTDVIAVNAATGELRWRQCATTARRRVYAFALNNLKQPCCTRDEGRPLGLGLQDQGSNHRLLRRSNDRGGERDRKRQGKTLSGEC